MKPEQKLQNAVCDYLKARHPNVMFMVSASGFNTDNRKGAQLARMQNPSKGWPDLFIAEVKGYRGDNLCLQIEYAGLFIELKPEKTRLKKKDGTWASEHIETQAKVHQILSYIGYKAEFAVGFDQAVKLIEEYLR